jgi:hypothetical protein
VAVGGRSGASTGTLSETWNGTKWSVVTTPNPKGSTGADLLGVACTSAKNCLAVGRYFVPGKTLPTAETWNGTKWSPLTVPAPAGTTNASLDAVACASGTGCQAVGSSMDNTLAESWNGTKWSIVSSPSPNPAKPEVLSGLACLSAKDCWAVGFYFPTNFSGSLTERWNGSKWSIVSTPTSRSGELVGAGCFSALACMSVGISNKLFAIAQVWKGAAWAAATPAKPGGGSGSELTGVSCSAAVSCESVGNYATSGSTATLGERWNGAKWAVQKTPAVSGSIFASLQNVSCPSKAGCWAVGESFKGSVSTPLIDRWNGKTWSLAAG